ncbi:MAG: class I SAM-dependent methyltransferase [Aestuariivirga sp.]
MTAETDIQANLAQVAQSYDTMPYVSVGVKQSQPNRLAAIAQIFGLAAKPLAQARVLEIGCAEGGNILPLALRFPKAEFVGIDISPVQIERGQQQAKALGVNNLDLHCRSVTDLNPALVQFDFIICHGIYSWVERPVQDAIFGALKSHLAPQGIGFVSYNVLPGWRMKQPFRDAAHALLPQGLALPEKARAATELLSFLAAHSDASSGYGLALREVQGRLTQTRTDYVAHEYLEDANTPCTLTAFLQRASSAGLAYLGDAEISEMIPIGSSPELQQEIARRSGGDQVAMEQLMDFIKGRQFRSTLLVHDHQAAQISRVLHAERLRGLHFSCRSNTNIRVESGNEVLITDGMSPWPMPDETYAQIMARLIAAYPASIPFSTLLTGLGDLVTCSQALLALVMYGVVDASSDAIDVANALGSRPKVFRLAAHAAATGAAQTTSLLHGVVQLDAMTAYFLAAMDGTKTVIELTADFVQRCASGQFQLAKDGKTVTGKNEIAKAAARQADEVMQNLVRLALIESPR